MHAGGIQLNYAVFIRKTSVADRIVGWIELLNLHPFDGSIECIRAAEHELHRSIHGGKTVARADCGRPAHTQLDECG
jgi:hypothetical protein